jgi:hypothetical protein
VTTPAARRTSLFAEPLPTRRRLRLNRFAVTMGLLLGGIALLVLMGLFSLTRAVVHRNVERDNLKAMASEALPDDAVAVTTGFLGATDAFAVGDVPTKVQAVLAALADRRGAAHWNEIPGTATATSRSYLSTGQDRILEVTVRPCQRHRPQCPAGGSTVTAEVSIGGPKS